MARLSLSNGLPPLRSKFGKLILVVMAENYKGILKIIFGNYMYIYTCCLKLDDMLK